jgi:hypothetical protein
LEQKEYYRRISDKNTHQRLHKIKYDKYFDFGWLAGSIAEPGWVGAFGPERHPN